MRRPRTDALRKLIPPLAAALLLTHVSAAAVLNSAGTTATHAQSDTATATSDQSAPATATRARFASSLRQSQSASSTQPTGPRIVSIKDARARPLGSEVTIEGTVTTPPGAFKSSTEDEGFAVEDASGAGLYVRANAKANVRVGQRVRVAGRLDESNGKLVIVPADARGIERLGRRVAPSSPRRVSTREIGEGTEGLLVRVAGRITKAVQTDAPYGSRLFVDDGTGEVQIFVNASTKIPTAGLRAGRRVSVTGFSGQYKETYEVEPRFASDISFRR